MNLERSDRGMILTPFRTRCLLAGEIHEFVLCEEGLNPDAPIDRVSYLGFGEILTGGVAEIGDGFFVDGKRIGTLIGFDETHAPNHYNILIASSTLRPGSALGLQVDGDFSIRSRSEMPQ
jgi:hypothetical protein